ncbi:uncharacterized protein MELLADRAFT_110453 [Melampsora larici-populina 98AG31]|uniref:Uncharacterized protein n=1 Tax=Melampsora larici-populina (strain 98AG31 / pathotype 3-4-7) TaxID=747676 RepID=F4RZV2_MELLP|nr:uncharacterized protein MELLADRAFT_110453 [Melampsora larici-populina 98AG31]EGG02066.1 hypothetical protein MELLADRAFT_110453 [Melampsora larici-populina 98AG31]
MLRIVVIVFGPPGVHLVRELGSLFSCHRVVGEYYRVCNSEDGSACVLHSIFCAQRRLMPSLQTAANFDGRFSAMTARKPTAIGLLTLELESLRFQEVQADWIAHSKDEGGDLNNCHLAGYISAMRGLIDADCRKRLNRLNICLFTPALLFGKVAFSLTPDTLKSLWVVPVGFFLVTGLSALAGLILSGIFRANTSQRAIIVSGSMFMNTNTIPVALIQSLSMSLPILKSNPDDKAEDQLARALSYLLVYGLLGSFVRWSLGVKLFESANEKMEQMLSDAKHVHEIDETKSNSSLSKPTLTTPSSDGQNPVYLHENLDITSSLTSQALQSPLITSEIRSPNEDTIRTPFLAQNERGSENCNFNSTCSCESCNLNKGTRFEDEPACFQSPNRGSTLTEKTLVDTPPIAKDLESEVPINDSFHQKISKGFLQVSKGVKDILNPPLISATAAVIVACIPPVQEFLGKISPLRHLLNIAGSVSIPLTLIALGAYFYQPLASEIDLESATPISKSPTQISQTQGENKTIILTLVSRQLITPLIFIPILAYLVIYSHILVFKDPIFVMTAVLVIGGPPATTLAQMSSRTCADFDRMISRMLFWSFSSVTCCTLYTAAFSSLNATLQDFLP